MDQAGNKQAEIQFLNGQTDRLCNQLLWASCDQLSWASGHQLSKAICHEHKKAGKGDQTGRNSVLTTDRQTDGDKSALVELRFAAKNELGAT